MKKKDIKILLVDDEQDILEIVGYNLTQEGYQISTASNGKEAIQKAKKELPHLIIMDVMMPEMDGYETMKNIRRDDKHKDLTIIAVTAKAMKGDRQKCIESGASDYITKPVNVDQLSSLMRVWLKK